MREFEFRPLPTGLRAGEEAGPEPDLKVARLQAKAAEKRTDRHDAVQTWAEKRRVLREDRRVARVDRRQERAEQLADRTARYGRLRARTAAIAQRALVTGPIMAPMAVAWTGQSEFAMRILGWAFPFALVFAAAYELTTAYWAWLYHQARSDGDHGWEYRTGTWVFAIGAGIQQWWHYSDNWHATPRAVIYSAMSGIGVLLWEGYARLIHRRKLRAEGKLPPARPRIGLARWTRYPVRSWTTRSLIILRDYGTLAEAWTAADETIRDRQAERDRSRRDCETPDRKVSPKASRRRPETTSVAPGARAETKQDRAAETTPERSRETAVPQATAETTARETAETSAVAIGDREGEIRALVSLMETRGDPMAVSLADAIETTGCPKSTAAKRLAAARDRYRKSA